LDVSVAYNACCTSVKRKDHANLMKVARNRGQLDLQGHKVVFAGFASCSSDAFVFRLLPSACSLQPYLYSAIHLFLFVLPSFSFFSFHGRRLLISCCCPCFFRLSPPSPSPLPILDSSQELYPTHPSRPHHVQPPRPLHSYLTLCRSTNLCLFGSPPGGHPKSRSQNWPED
jgi:hypothetical protein